jgi:hypothetical protein
MPCATITSVKTIAHPNQSDLFILRRVAASVKAHRLRVWGWDSLCNPLINRRKTDA